MGQVALVTGASSGIGTELARYHAGRGGDLVVVARREDALNQLKQELEREFNITVTVIAADLSVAEAAEKIFQTTESQGIQVDILINNAGFGGHGKFYQRDLQRDLEMMQVNMNSLVQLTHLYVQGMVARKEGKLLHVASTAGFLPGPLQATYYATKAFVVSFSQAIAQELEGTGVTSTALCPGPVATEFMSAAHLEGVEIWKMAKTPRSVAICGYDAMLRGDLIKINEMRLHFLLNWVVPWLPRKWVLRMSQMTMSKK
ncbi:MAG: SDR family oxidoreductase [Zetaproteobacteria bacterium]|nr:SDR family oxidoreductase [Zetaproteobacteria bacterium]